MSSSSIQLENFSSLKEIHDENRMNIIIKSQNQRKNPCKSMLSRNKNFNDEKKRINELLKGSTAHGIPNIMKSNSLIIKIMWAVFFIASTVAGSYYTIDSILDYLRFNTVTTIQILDEEKSEFPTVSFCGFPKFNSSIERIVLSVKFQNEYKTNLSSVFEEFDDPVFSKCFRFNSREKNLLHATTTGLSSNLRIQFDLEIAKDYDFTELLINIHNQSDPPYSMENGGYWLKTGSLNYFQVDREFVDKLPQPYNDCIKEVKDYKNNSTIIDQILKKSEKYSQINCFRLCSHLMALEESNCSCNSSLIDFEKYCIKHFFQEDTQVFRCIATYLKNLTNEPRLYKKKCSKYCPLECDSMSLKISNYMVHMPEIGNISNQSKSAYHLDNYSTYEQVSKHFIEIYVYFKDLRYIQISQEPKTETFTFISNIGGILGVFLGISFLSFIEILEIFFHLCIFLVK